MLIKGQEYIVELGSIYCDANYSANDEEVTNLVVEDLTSSVVAEYSGVSKEAAEKAIEVVFELSLREIPAVDIEQILSEV